MDQAKSQSQRISPAIKLLFGLISLVVVSVGIEAVVTSYAPPRSTRWGVQPALDGPEARHFGSSVILIGLLPLLSLSKSPRNVAILGALLAAALLINTFFGAHIWA